MKTTSYTIDPAARDALIETERSGATVEIEVRESGCYVVITQHVALVAV